MIEQWKSISGFEGIYEISSFGRVRRLAWSLRTGDRIFYMKSIKIARNYRAIGLRKPNKGKKRFLIHRLVALAFIPNPFNLPEVNHKDGDPSNNSASNLEWISSTGNKYHATRTLYRIAKALGKTYSFISPDGNVFKVRNLTEFSEEHSLTRSVLSRVHSGAVSHHKGWRKYEDSEGMAGQRKGTA